MRENSHLPCDNVYVYLAVLSSVVMSPNAVAELPCPLAPMLPRCVYLPLRNFVRTRRPQRLGLSAGLFLMMNQPPYARMGPTNCTRTTTKGMAQGANHLQFELNTIRKQSHTCCILTTGAVGTYIHVYK